MKRTILVVDDHPLVGSAIRMAIAAQWPNLAVEVAPAIEPALRIAEARRDLALVLLDYRLPHNEGFSGFFRLRHALGKVPIALISAFESPRLIAAAYTVGAAGFLPKSMPLADIARAAGQLLAGMKVFAPDIRVPDSFAALRPRLEALSPAQQRVLAALVSGHLNKQIAGDLGIAEATIKTHLSAIFRKLGVANRLQAVVVMKPLLDPDGG